MILLKLNFEDNGVVVDNRGRLWSVGRIDGFARQATIGCGSQGVLSSWRLIIFRVFGRVQVGRFRYIS